MEVNIKLLRDLAIKYGAISIYDAPAYSHEQLIYYISNKLNEVINATNQFTTELVEEDIKFKKEVLTEINKWIDFIEKQIGEDNLIPTINSKLEEWLKMEKLNIGINDKLDSLTSAWSSTKVKNELVQVNTKVDKLKAGEINVLTPPAPYTAWETGKDVTNSFKAMLNDGRAIYIPSGAYTVSSSLSTDKCPLIYGNATIYYTGINYLLNIATNGFKIKGLTIKGNKATNQFGFNITNKKNIEISNMEITGFIRGLYGTQSVGTFNTGTVDNCKICNNTIGIDCDVRFEYFNINNCIINSNNTGIRIVGGNINVNGNIITNNDIGISVFNGDNGGHGIISNNQINHNKNFSIVMTEVPNGYTISGNNVFYGNLQIQSCKSGAILLNGNTLACKINIQDSHVVDNGNFINQTTNSIVVDDLSVIKSNGTLTDYRGGYLKSAKFNANETMLSVESNKTGKLFDMKTADNGLKIFNKFNYYLGGLGQMVTTNKGFYDVETGAFNCSKSSNSIVTVDYSVNFGLNKEYTQEPPTLYIQTITDTGTITNYRLGKSCFDAGNGVRYCYYTGSKKILIQRNMTFKFVVLLPSGADSNHVMVRDWCKVDVFGI